MLKKSLMMLKRCTYNSLSIAHYSQVEPTIMLTETDMRHNETQLRVTISLLPCARILKWAQSRRCDKSPFTHVKTATCNCVP